MSNLTLVQQVLNAQRVINCAVRDYQRLTGDFGDANTWLTEFNRFIPQLVNELEGKEAAPVVLPYPES